MARPSATSLKMRIFHRYLGFFLAGIMAIYAISGIVLIFRDSDVMKREISYSKTINTQLNEKAIGQAIGDKRFKIERIDGDSVYFKNGAYNKATGIVNYTKMELPYVLQKMTHLHKAKSSQPLFFLNITFGLGLLFFVLSGFWMFMPGSSLFKKGMYYTAAGVILALVLLFI
ncbi:hypothetical protein FNJ87_01895 [Nonlabens mediterrranea]|uniref:Peptidase n=1 Tax=Nonlabens mediterrranea TaxID=1419947 RepID=A0ABS0A1Y6_9FLAO|nr:hypothetical protein [Nonlabens mediterrranea]